MLPSNLVVKIQELNVLLRKKNLLLCTAESCTGGLISMAITEIPGSSEIFERGYVTYSNASKIELLTVPTFYIEDYGAVSFEVAVAMAEGALLMSKADVCISVTGCAGPDGGTEEKPVGTVFVGFAKKGSNTVYKNFTFKGDRNSIRIQAAAAAIEYAVECLS